jgi:hypothetical protein
VKIKVRIPDTLGDITLGQYQKWLDIQGDEEFRTMKLIEIFCGITLREVSQLRVSDINHIAETIASVLQVMPNLRNRFKIADKEFGFIPSLDDITLGEYTDIEENMGDWDKMHKVMAVFYRPVSNSFGQFYAIEEYTGTDKYAQIMKEIPLDVAFGAVNFMYRLGTELCKVTLVSMQNEMKAAATSQKWEDSLNGGGGITSSTHLPTEMLLGLRKLANLTFTSLSPTPLTIKKKAT